MVGGFIATDIRNPKFEIEIEPRSGTRRARPSYRANQGCLRVRYAQKLTVPHACILRHVLRHDRIVSLAGPSPHHAGDGGIGSASAERAAEPLSPPCIPPLSPLARHCSE